MKKFWQIYLLLFLLFFIYDWNFNCQVDKILNNITNDQKLILEELNAVEKELDDTYDQIENISHTRVEEIGYYTYDTTEQIEEEIKLGEMELLAQLIEAEAGNQDYKGKCLVADVVLNRIKSDRFANTLEGVIFEKDQFSSVSDGNFNKAAWNISEDSFKAAYQEYEAGDENRIDNIILFFTVGEYNPYCIPMYKYGDHYFGY